MTILFIFSPTATMAGEADVLDVEVMKTGTDVYSFRVTVRHDDTGWKHYANWWEVLDLDGNVLGKRVLLHPHVNEQPFKRTLTKVKIPRSVNKVMVRAHDLVHGLGGQTRTATVPR